MAVKELEKRRRRSLFDEFFSPFESFEGFFSEFSSGSFAEAGSGYSINVTQIDGKTKVLVRASKDMDVTELKQHLKEQYPNAEIVVEGGRPLIEEIKEYPKEEEAYKKEVKGKAKSRGSLIIEEERE
jgi:hypothetical protein